MPADTAFEHDAFFYRTDEQFTATLLPYLRAGLAGGDTVAVATSAGRIQLLRDALGSAADAVTFLPDEQWYVRPVTTIAGWARVAAGAAAHGRRARLVGEVRFGAVEQHSRWVRCESAVNRAMAHLPAQLICPYDMRALPPSVLHEGRRTHPTVRNGRRMTSDGYLSPEQLFAEVAEPPFPVSGEPALDLVMGDTVAGLRDLVRALVAAHGWLPAARLDDLILGVSEVATNGVRHGAGQRRLLLWGSTEAVVCEVSDEGPGPADPLVGYLPPVPGALGGMGLWLVQQICDSLSIHTADGRTRVRFAVRPK